MVALPQYAALSLPLDTVVHGDALSVLRTLPENSIDAICCDPPAGISFMGKAFDSNRGGRNHWIAWLAEIMREALRCLKPGGHALIWALPRTSHWTAFALEEAGFEIRDCMYHIFGSGFPKSTAIDKQIDKHFKAEREVIGVKRSGIGRHGRTDEEVFHGSAPEYLKQVDITKPATPEAEQYAGYGSALKPAVEQWILCRKPLSEKSLAANVLKWGVGGLAIDKCRVGNDTSRGDRYHGKPPNIKGEDSSTYGIGLHKLHEEWSAPQGRWPSHLLLSHSVFCTDDACFDGCPIAEMDRQSGVRKSVRSFRGEHADMRGDNYNRSNGARQEGTNTERGYDDQGGASRYFQQFTPDVPFLYCGKASKRDRSSNGAVENTHPTVKNTSLISYLSKLICPENGVILDMFAGSGTLGVCAIQNGFHYILIEQEREYADIARARIAQAYKEVGEA